MNRAELKAAAKTQIKGKIGVLFLITLIICLVAGVVGVLGAIPFVGIVVSIIGTFVITPAFGLSVVRIYLNVTDGNKPSARDAFCGFDDFWSSFKTTFLVGLFTMLWSLLLVIPGIIKGYSYSMAMYILAENKGMSARECIRKSKEMTQGHKWELFVLELSFLGWGLLGTITLGIGYIWIIPYMAATEANAYRYLKAQAKAE